MSRYSVICGAWRPLSEWSLWPPESGSRIDTCLSSPIRRGRRGPGWRLRRRRCSICSATRDPMSVLRETPGALRRAIDGCPRRSCGSPNAGKWSIAQVLRHLADSDLVWGWRLRLILAQDRPTLTGYDQDAWADAPALRGGRPGRLAPDVRRPAPRQPAAHRAGGAGRHEARRRALGARRGSSSTCGGCTPATTCCTSADRADPRRRLCRLNVPDRLRC